MAQNWEGAAPREDGPGSRALAGNGSEHSAVRHAGQLSTDEVTSALKAAILSALSRTALEDRAAVLEWLAEWSLLRLARWDGVRVAACAAYEIADQLAAAVK